MEKARNFLGEMEMDRSDDRGRREEERRERDLKRIKGRLNKIEEETVIGVCMCG